MSTVLLFAVFGLGGIASGFFAGLFGIGGGLIMVPILVYAFKTTGMVSDHILAMALGTSMAAIVFSSAQSAYGHYYKGSASLEKIRLAAPWVVAGVLIGGSIAVRIPAHPLLVFVGGFQLLAALLMLTDVSKLVTLQSLARGGVALGFFSLFFGGVAAMVGIGGGTLFIPYFKASGMEPKLAIGTSAAIGLPISLAGVLAYGWQGWGVSGDQWAIGYIDMPAALALVLGTLLTVRLGVVTAHRLPSRALAGLFALFLFFNGAHLLYSALG
ncbi:MAG: sulfite exporter TauE/SafE family protein [Xanthobacteraceae bacterium]